MLNNKGISLVEIMVSIAIMTFLMAALQTTLLTAQNSLNYSNTNGQLQQSNSQGLSRLSLELNSAEALMVTDSGNNDTLKFVDVSSYYFYKYYINNDNELEKQVLDASDESNVISTTAIAPNIVYFNVESYDDSAIDIKITSKKRLKGNSERCTLDDSDPNCENNPLLTDEMIKKIAFRNTCSCALRDGILDDQKIIEMTAISNAMDAYKKANGSHPTLWSELGSYFSDIDRFEQDYDINFNLN